MKNLLFVLETKSHVLASIKEQLAKFDYRTIEVPAEVDAINKVTDPVNGVLIYVEGQMLEQLPAINFIKDWSLANGAPIFVIGHPKDIKEIKNIIPAQNIRLEFVRPLVVNVSELASQIHEFITKDSAKKKILVVDDSGVMLRTVKEWLDDRYNVFLANSGAMTIKYLTLNRPDLILLDYAMPVVDGRQVLEMIRTESDFQDIPVMFLTNKGDPESIMSVKDLKPEGYLVKSLEPAQIIKAVDDFFEQLKAMGG